MARAPFPTENDSRTAASRPPPPPPPQYFITHSVSKTPKEAHISRHFKTNKNQAKTLRPERGEAGGRGEGIPTDKKAKTESLTSTKTRKNEEG